MQHEKRYEAVKVILPILLYYNFKVKLFSSQEEWKKISSIYYLGTGDCSAIIVVNSAIAIWIYINKTMAFDEMRIFIASKLLFDKVSEINWGKVNIKNRINALGIV